MRRAVAAKVSESFATVPHFYLRSEVDVTTLMALRQSVAETIEKQCGVRPSLTDFLLRAMALALRDHPQANRIWQNDSIVPLPSIDVGLVVQVERWTAGSHPPSCRSAWPGGHRPAAGQAHGHGPLREDAGRHLSGRGHVAEQPGQASRR